MLLLLVYPLPAEENIGEYCQSQNKTSSHKYLNSLNKRNRCRKNSHFFFCVHQAELLQVCWECNMCTSRKPCLQFLMSFLHGQRGFQLKNEEPSHERWASCFVIIIYSRTVQQSCNFFTTRSEIPANDGAQPFRCVYFSPPLSIHCWLLLLQAEIYTLVLPLVTSPKASLLVLSFKNHLVPVKKKETLKMLFGCWRKAELQMSRKCCSDDKWVFSTVWLLTLPLDLFLSDMLCPSGLKNTHVYEALQQKHSSVSLCEC